MRLHHCLSIASLVALVAAQGKCRFGNGTLLPDVPEWNIYQPCPGADGPTTICCAIGRTNPPWGNISLGSTQDECLPNGLCQNRVTSNEGQRSTTYFVDYCTESGQSNSAGKCLNVQCNTGSFELTAKLTPCDGTANSSRWCCGDNTECCDSGSGFVSLGQVLGQVSSSVISTSPTATLSDITTPTTSQVPASSTPADTKSASSGSSRLSGGAIAGIVIGAVVGLAFLAAALFFARRASQRKKNAGYAAPAANEAPAVTEVPNNPAMQELGPTVKYAHVQEMPGSPPGELQGDVPAHANQP